MGDSSSVFSYYSDVVCSVDVSVCLELKEEKRTKIRDFH